MSRLPPMRRRDLSAEQRRVLDAIFSGPRARAHAEGAEPVGPFGPWLLSPEIADRAQRLGEAVRFRTSFEPRLSELAILVVGAIWKADFEFATHAPIGEAAGLDPRIVDALRRGEPPPEMAEDEACVHAFVSELCRQHRVSDPVWERATGLFGARGAMELVAIAGYYTLICMTLNAFEIPPPEGVPSPFAGGGPEGGAESGCPGEGDSRQGEGP